MIKQEVVEFIDGPWAGRQGMVAAPVPGVIRPAGAVINFRDTGDAPIPTKIGYHWIEADDWYRLEVKP